MYNTRYMDKQNKSGSFIWYVLVGLIIIAVAVWGLSMTKEEEMPNGENSEEEMMEEMNEEEMMEEEMMMEEEEMMEEEMMEEESATSTL